MDLYSFIDEIDFINSKDVILEIKTTDKVFYKKLGKFYKNIFLMIPSILKNTPPNTTVFREEYDGLIIKPNVKYILKIKENNREKVILIYESGMMSDDIIGINVISKLAVSDISKLKFVIDDLVKNSGGVLNSNYLLTKRKGYTKF